MIPQVQGYVHEQTGQWGCVGQQVSTDHWTLGWESLSRTFCFRPHPQSRGYLHFSAPSNPGLWLTISLALLAVENNPLPGTLKPFGSFTIRGWP